MNYKEERRKEKAEYEAKKRQMHREINTPNFELAFKIWCVFHPHCRHCQFRKSFGGCVEAYYRKYYHPEVWEDLPY